MLSLCLRYKSNFKGFIWEKRHDFEIKVSGRLESWHSQEILYSSPCRIFPWKSHHCCIQSIPLTHPPGPGTQNKPETMTCIPTVQLHNFSAPPASVCSQLTYVTQPPHWFSLYSLCSRSQQLNWAVLVLLIPNPRSLRPGPLTHSGPRGWHHYQFPFVQHTLKKWSNFLGLRFCPLHFKGIVNLDTGIRSLSCGNSGNSCTSK